MTVSETMDGLWDPPHYQVTEDTNCGNGECQCVSCLANDVVEERALNELSCIEVLRALISKADADIIELEDELIDLMIQIVCSEKEFSDMFSMCLRREIDVVNRSIRKLKDDAAGDYLSTSRKPAESMLEILKSFFCLYIQKKDKQFADNIKHVASSSSLVHSVKKQTITSSNANQMEKNKRIMNTSLEKHKIPQTRVKTEEVDADYPYTGLYQCSMEKWKHQLVKIKSQTDEESIGSKSAIIPYTSQFAPYQDDLQQPIVSLFLSSNKTYKRRQKLNPPLQTGSTSPCLLLLEGAADVADTHSGVDMTVDELRAIAKERGVKGYSKLRKLELAQMLGIKIVEGKRKQKRKESVTLLT